MNINDWRFYNHAAIPTVPPHKTPDLSVIENGEIWKIEGNPVLARWTTEFDCPQETNWWYVIKDAPFDIEQLPKSQRKHIRQALKKCYVNKVDFDEHIDDFFRVYNEAYEKYENADNKVDLKTFKERNQNSDDTSYFAGYDFETNRMIGYMVAKSYDEYAEITIAKFSPEFLKLQVSDALYATVLEYYLNELGKKYICSGERSINHKTQTQDYKMRTFAYRKAYCKLNVVYNPKIKTLIKVAYPIRFIFKMFDFITPVHQFNAVLKMEGIARGKKC